MLQSPKSGDNILAWARNATKEINSNIIHNGIGIKVLRTPQGTNISVQPSTKAKSGTTDLPVMPFDVRVDGDAQISDGETGQPVQAVACIVSTCGPQSNVIYTIGANTRFIPFYHDEYEETVTVALPTSVGGRIFIVVEFVYGAQDEDSGSGSGSDESNNDWPTQYIIQTYEFDDDEEEAGSAISDGLGYRRIPIAYIEKIKDAESDSGSEEEEEEEPEPLAMKGAKVTIFSPKDAGVFKLVQVHHGNIKLFKQFSGGVSTCRIGDVTGGSSGIFTCDLLTFDGLTEYARVCACDLAMTSNIPIGTRIVAHPIDTPYIGGN